MGFGHAIGREHWAINSTASIVPRGMLTESELQSRLRRAWGHLRYQHPSLSEDDANVIYDIPDRQKLGEWVDETFRVEESLPSAAEVIPTLKPTAYASLVYIKKSG